MREILFKAKRIDNEEWVEGSYLYCEKATTVSFRNEHYMLVFDGYGVAYHEIDKDTICQFTGLYDGTKWEDLTEEEKQAFYEEVCSEDGKSIKYQNFEDVKHLWKGKKIWENDVVNIHIFHEVAEGYGKHIREKGVICYDKIGMLSIAVDITDGIPCYSDILFQAEIAGIEFDIEVIGTKFDNPELLGG